MRPRPLQVRQPAAESAARLQVLVRKDAAVPRRHGRHANGQKAKRTSLKQKACTRLAVGPQAESQCTRLAAAERVRRTRPRRRSALPMRPLRCTAWGPSRWDNSDDAEMAWSLWSRAHAALHVGFARVCSAKWAHLCGFCLELTPATSAPGLGLTAPTSAQGLGAPRPHLLRGWGLAAPASAPGLLCRA
jgi:hypothetical protein